MKYFVIFVTLLVTGSVSADISQLKLELLLAKRGDLAAQFRVATSYEYGTDVKKNLKESFKWYMKAANQSHAPSQYKIGYFYENALGVAKDMDKAMQWYKKAKNNGSDKASRRLNNTAYEKKKKLIQAQRIALQAKLDKEDKARKEKLKKIVKKKVPVQHKVKHQNKVIKKASKKKVVKKVVKKVKKPVKKAVVKKKVMVFKVADLMKIILTNKWKNKDGDSDYLPSASTACLASGDSEMTCFSSEKSRKIKSATVAYTTKSTLVGFRKNGSFKVIYNYNALNIAGARSNIMDKYGLTMKQGWQEPAIAVKCKALDRKNITCYRGSSKVSFTR